MEERLEELRTGPYGRCVYRCGNNVVDHQTVNMEFEDGVTAALIMQGYSNFGNRTVRFDGTRGTLEGRFQKGDSELSVHDHRTGNVERFEYRFEDSHGGSDERLMADFVQAVRGDGGTRMSGSVEAAESHLMALASEESRLNGGAVVDMEEFRRAAAAASAGPGGDSSP